MGKSDPEKTAQKASRSLYSPLPPETHLRSDDSRLSMTASVVPSYSTLRWYESKITINPNARPKPE